MNDIFELKTVPQNNGPSPESDMFTGGRAIQQVRTSYATAVAVQKPRDLIGVERSLTQEANLAGESFYYGWSVGKEAIEGPSVKLANAAARCWGNCAIEFLPVQDLPDAWIFTALFVDLETGFTLPRQFRQSKGWKIHGRMDDERKADVRFQIGQSKAVRNVVLNALPSWLIDHAMSAAKAGVKAKIEKYINANGKAAAVEAILKALGKQGVKEEAVLRKIGVAKAEAVEIDDLVVLRGDLTALEAGEVYASELYPEEKAQHSPSPAGSKTEQLADRLGATPEQPAKADEQRPQPQPYSREPKAENPDSDLAFETLLDDIKAADAKTLPACVKQIADGSFTASHERMLRKAAEVRTENLQAGAKAASNDDF